LTWPDSHTLHRFKTAADFERTGGIRLEAHHVEVAMSDNKEQNHETMRAAAQTAVTGPAASPLVSNLAGLEVPGGEPHPIAPADDGAHEPIPGERDPGNLTHREAGAIGRSPASDAPAGDAAALLSDDDVEELRHDFGDVRRTHTK
jgi:hypothetical protein